MSTSLQKRLEEIGAPDDVKALAAELAEQAVRDPLTGLYNRRFFDEALARNIETARRYDRNLSLVLFDLDDFKVINDCFGHEAGDEALRVFARILQQTARAADLVCRMGGDEFAVLLPETEMSKVQIFIDRFFRALEAGCAGLIEKALSASCGVAALPSENLFGDADRALLAAKPGSAPAVGLSKSRC